MLGVDRSTGVNVFFFSLDFELIFFFNFLPLEPYPKIFCVSKEGSYLLYQNVYSKVKKLFTGTFADRRKIPQKT
jgi:hypothetical protein